MHVILQLSDHARQLLQRDEERVVDHLVINHVAALRLHQVVKHDKKQFHDHVIHVLDLTIVEHVLIYVEIIQLLDQNNVMEVCQQHWQRKM